MHGGLRQGSHGDEALGTRGLWHCLLLASPSRRAPPRPLQPAGPCAPDGDAGDAAQGLPRRLPQRTRQSRPGSASADACCAAGRSGPFYMMDGSVPTGGRARSESSLYPFRMRVWRKIARRRFGNAPSSWDCSLGSRAGSLPIDPCRCGCVCSDALFKIFMKDQYELFTVHSVDRGIISLERASGSFSLRPARERARARATFEERWHGARLHWPAPSPLWCSRVEWLRRFTFRHDWAHCRHFARRSVSKVALCRPPTPQLARWLLPK